MEDELVNGDISTHDIHHTLPGPITDLINTVLENLDSAGLERVANYVGHLSGQLRDLLIDCLRNTTEPGCHVPTGNLGEIFDFQDEWQNRERIRCVKAGDLQLELMLESHLLRLELLHLLEHVSLMVWCQRFRAHRYVFIGAINTDLYINRCKELHQLVRIEMRLVSQANLVHGKEKRKFRKKILELTNNAASIFENIWPPQEPPQE